MWIDIVDAIGHGKVELARELCFRIIQPSPGTCQICREAKPASLVYAQAWDFGREEIGFQGVAHGKCLDVLKQYGFRYVWVPSGVTYRGH